MPFAIKMHEPVSVPYLFVDEYNQMHLLMPVIGGADIGLDNTCQTLKGLRVFWEGTSASDEFSMPSAENSLIAYKKALKKDIALLKHINTELLKQKEERLKQVEAYISLVNSISSSWRFIYRYPVSIKYFFAKRTNCVTIQLSPREKDNDMKTSSPIFSVSRIEDGLGEELHTTFFSKFTSPQPHSTYKGWIDQREDEIKEVLQDFKTCKIWSEDSIRQMLDGIQTVLDKYQQHVPRDDRIILQKSASAAVVKREIANALWLDPDNDLEISFKELLPQILSYSLKDSSWYNLLPSVFIPLRCNNSFSRRKEADLLSIKTQFFLAQVNIYCYQHNLLGSQLNLGNIFDQEPYRAEIANIVWEAVAKYEAPEDALFEYINTQCFEPLGLKEKLTSEQQRAIREKFDRQYKTIAASPHFDEFIIFLPEEKQGDFFNHNNRVSVHLWDVISYFDRCSYSIFSNYSQSLKASNERVLSSKNPGVVCELTFNGLLKSLSPETWPSIRELLSSKDGKTQLKGLLPEERALLSFHPMWPGIQDLVPELVDSECMHLVNYDLLKELLEAGQHEFVYKLLKQKDAKLEFNSFTDDKKHFRDLFYIQANGSLFTWLEKSTHNQDEKKYIHACGDYLEHLAEALKQNPDDELAQRKQDIVFDAFLGLLTHDNEPLNVKIDAFRDILGEGNNRVTLCTRRDSSFNRFVKKLGFLGDLLFNLGNRISGFFPVQGETFLNEVESIPKPPQ